MPPLNPRSFPTPVSDLTAKILDPVLRKRAGLSVALIQSWEEIVGPRLSGLSRPERIRWPRRASETDPFEPATLVVACEGAAALRLQHETASILSRVNAFLGFAAIGRIRLVQKPVAPAKPPRPTPEPLTPSQAARLTERVAAVTDPELRQSLQRLGASVLGSRRRAP